MQVGKLGNIGGAGGTRTSGGLQEAEWQPMPLTALSESGAVQWRSRHGNLPPAAPVPVAEPEPEPKPTPQRRVRIPVRYHYAGPDGQSELLDTEVASRIRADSAADHHVWHADFPDGWRLWSEVPALVALVNAGPVGWSGLCDSLRQELLATVPANVVYVSHRTLGAETGSSDSLTALPEPHEPHIRVEGIDAHALVAADLCAGWLLEAGARVVRTTFAALLAAERLDDIATALASAGASQAPFPTPWCRFLHAHAVKKDPERARATLEQARHTHKALGALEYLTALVATGQPERARARIEDNLRVKRHPWAGVQVLHHLLHDTARAKEVVELVRASEDDGTWSYALLKQLGIARAQAILGANEATIATTLDGCEATDLPDQLRLAEATLLYTGDPRASLRRVLHASPETFTNSGASLWMSALAHASLLGDTDPVADLLQCAEATARSRKEFDPMRGVIEARVRVLGDYQGAMRTLVDWEKRSPGKQDRLHIVRTWRMSLGDLDEARRSLGEFPQDHKPHLLLLAAEYRRLGQVVNEERVTRQAEAAFHQARRTPGAKAGQLSFDWLTAVHQWVSRGADLDRARPLVKSLMADLIHSYHVEELAQLVAALGDASLMDQLAHSLAERAQRDDDDWWEWTADRIELAEICGDVLQAPAVARTLLRFAESRMDDDELAEDTRALAAAWRHLLADEEQAARLDGFVQARLDRKRADCAAGQSLLDSGQFERLTLQQLKAMAGEWSREAEEQGHAQAPPEFSGFFVVVDSDDGIKMGSILTGAEWEGDDMPKWRVAYGWTDSSDDDHKWVYVSDVVPLASVWHDSFKTLARQISALESGGSGTGSGPWVLIDGSSTGGPPAEPSSHEDAAARQARQERVRASFDAFKDAVYRPKCAISPCADQVIWRSGTVPSDFIKWGSEEGLSVVSLQLHPDISWVCLLSRRTDYVDQRWTFGDESEARAFIDRHTKDGFVITSISTTLATTLATKWAVVMTKLDGASNGMLHTSETDPKGWIDARIRAGDHILGAAVTKTHWIAWSARLATNRSQLAVLKNSWKSSRDFVRQKGTQDYKLTAIAHRDGSNLMVLTQDAHPGKQTVAAYRSSRKLIEGTAEVWQEGLHVCFLGRDDDSLWMVTADDVPWL